MPVTDNLQVRDASPRLATNALVKCKSDASRGLPLVEIRAQGIVKHTFAKCFQIRAFTVD